MYRIIGKLGTRQQATLPGLDGSGDISNGVVGEVESGCFPANHCLLLAYAAVVAAGQFVAFLTTPL